MSDSAQNVLSKLHAQLACEITPAQLATQLTSGNSWLGEPTRLGGLIRYAVDLRLRVSDHPRLSTFHKAAIVEISDVESTDDHLSANISWYAAPFALLFPVFSGQLSLQDGRLALNGYYAPPGGLLGRTADKILFYIAANGTARWLLAQICKEADKLNIPHPPLDESDAGPSIST